jgi:hypothetical protein
MRRPIPQFKKESNKSKKAELEKILISINNGKKELSLIQKDIVKAEANKKREELEEKEAIENNIKVKKETDKINNEINESQAKILKVRDSLVDKEKKMSILDEKIFEAKQDLDNKNEIIYNLSNEIPEKEKEIKDKIEKHNKNSKIILDELKQKFKVEFEKLEKEQNDQIAVLVEKFRIERVSGQEKIKEELKKEEDDLIERISEKRKNLKELSGNYNFSKEECRDKANELEELNKKNKKVLDDIMSSEKILQVKVRKNQELETRITALENDKKEKQIEKDAIGKEVEIKKAEAKKIDTEMQKAKQTIFGLLRREEKIKKATPLIIEYYKKAGLNIELDI